MLLPLSNWEPKPLVYRVKFQNVAIRAKVVSVVCASFGRAQLGQKLRTTFHISRSRILLLWAAGEMKMQNAPIAPKMVLIVCAVIFFICATPLLKMWTKTPRIYLFIYFDID